MLIPFLKLLLVPLGYADCQFTDSFCLKSLREIRYSQVSSSKDYYCSYYSTSWLFLTEFQFPLLPPSVSFWKSCPILPPLLGLAVQSLPERNPAPFFQGKMRNSEVPEQAHGPFVTALARRPFRTFFSDVFCIERLVDGKGGRNLPFFIL